MSDNVQDLLISLFRERPAGQRITATLSGDWLGFPMSVTLNFTVPDNMDMVGEDNSQAVRIMLEGAFHNAYGVSRFINHEPITKVEIDVQGEADPVAVEEAIQAGKDAVEEQQRQAEKEQEAKQLRGVFGSLGEISDLPMN